MVCGLDLSGSQPFIIGQYILYVSQVWSTLETNTYLSEYERDHLLGLPVGGVNNMSEGGGR